MKRTALAALAATALLVTGCSPQPSAAPTLDVEPAAPAETPTPPGPALNERGQIIKKIGETGGWSSEDGKTDDLIFKVTSIKPIDCGDQAPKPNGMTIAVALEVKTSADFVGPLTVDGQPGFISFTPDNWKGYASNGTRMNKINTEVTINCFAHEAKELPDYIGKGEKASGIIILDVTTPKGEVAYESNGASWVWKYPGKKPATV
ncbi:hypothetical protein [Arthrobacter sp. GCM10027362]|uniref:hypothetical protein n=1 Tax=Arthrobacter sp. GCM10027362 TaxID=3273379 RepID=UPI003672560A